VVYKKSGSDWLREGFTAKSDFPLKEDDIKSQAEFSVATVDKSGLQSRKSPAVKVGCSDLGESNCLQ
jgi:hypothetical protein